MAETTTRPLRDRGPEELAEYHAEICAEIESQERQLQRCMSRQLDTTEKYELRQKLDAPNDEVLSSRLRYRLQDLRGLLEQTERYMPKPDPTVGEVEADCIRARRKLEDAARQVDERIAYGVDARLSLAHVGIVEGSSDARHDLQRLEEDLAALRLRRETLDAAIADLDQKAPGNG